MTNRLFPLLLTLFLLIPVSTSNVFATMNIAPVVTYNVHVLKKVTAAQCPTSWNGNTSPATVTVDSGMGTSSTGAVGMLSCVDCSYESTSGDCVCKTCYGYFD